MKANKVIALSVLGLLSVFQIAADPADAQMASRSAFRPTVNVSAVNHTGVQGIKNVEHKSFWSAQNLGLVQEKADFKADQKQILGIEHQSLIGNVDMAVNSGAKPVNMQQQAPAVSNNNANSILYGSNGAPVLSGLKQGRHDDCYFYNVLGWFAQDNPSAIEKMIQPLGNNSYQVTFANSKVETVTLTNSNTPYANLNGSDGVWVDVMANAYAQERGESLTQMLKGGRSMLTYDAFTGKAYTHEKLNGSSVNSLYSTFSNDQGDPMGLNTKGHALTIESFTADSSDPGNSTITVWNPWGSTGWFNPSTDGFSANQPKNSQGWIYMTNGTFTLTVSQLAGDNGNAGFDTITIPQGSNNNG